MRSPILLFAAKRANRAMLTSTMRQGLRDHDGAPPEPRQPMPLAGVVPLDAVGLLLARMELPDWQEHITNRVVVRTEEPRALARQSLDQAPAGGLVTTAAFPVHQPPCSTIRSFPDPERFGFFR